MSKENPTGFVDLDLAELRRTAVEDFACDIAPDANKKTVLAALTEDGVDWSQYAKLKGLNTVKSNPTPPPKVGPNVTGPLAADATEPVKIVTKEAIPVTSNEKYLIKMERENLRYDVRGHSFTKEHPYALVSAADAEYILSKEKGFRQAWPTELEEFYS